MTTLSTAPPIIRRWRVLVLLITIGLMLFTLWYVLTYTTTFPMAIDDWIRSVPRNILLLDGQLKVYDVVREGSQVVNAPPYPSIYGWLLSLPNVLLFHWNLKLDSLINYTFVVIDGLLTWFIVTRTQPQLRLALFAPIMALMVCIQQRWNLLVSNDIELHTQLFFVLLTFIGVSRPRQNWRNLVFAGFMAFGGTFATNAGPLTWGIAIPALWFLGYRRWQYLFFWMMSAAAATYIFIHFPDIGSVAGHYLISTNTGGLVSRIIGYGLFFLAYIGAVFNSGPDSNIAVSFLLGGFGLIAYGLNLIHLNRSVNNRSFIVINSLLAAYSLIYGVVAAISRADQFGVRQGLESHYITFSIPFWCALLGLVSLTIWQRLNTGPQKTPSRLIGVNAFLLVIGTIYFLVGAYDTIQVTQDHTIFVTAGQQCFIDVATGKISKPEGCEVVGGMALPEWIQTLYSHHLTGFGP